MHRSLSLAGAIARPGCSTSLPADRRVTPAAAFRHDLPIFLASIDSPLQNKELATLSGICPQPVHKTVPQECGNSSQCRHTRQAANRDCTAHFLGNPSFSLCNQRLGAVLRILSTTDPQSCPAPVWIPHRSTRLRCGAHFSGSPGNSVCDQRLSASIRRVSTSGPQRCPARLWKATGGESGLPRANARGRVAPDFFEHAAARRCPVRASKAA